MKKKTIIILLIVCLVMLFAACGNDDDNTVTGSKGDTYTVQDGNIAVGIDGNEYEPYTITLNLERSGIGQNMEETFTAPPVAAIADGDQSRVNNAVTLLARALSQLTSMDYSKLDPIVQEAEQYIHGTYENWLTLFELLMNYQNLYGCGDQAAVDQAAAEIKSCLETLQGKVAPPQTEPPVSPEPVQPKQKSPVVWIVLLIVSLMGNVVLTAFLLLPKEGNKEEQVDDVPLVDYDIDDDVV